MSSQARCRTSSQAGAGSRPRAQARTRERPFPSQERESEPKAGSNQVLSLARSPAQPTRAPAGSEYGRAASPDEVAARHFWITSKVSKIGLAEAPRARSKMRRAAASARESR